MRADLEKKLEEEFSFMKKGNSFEEQREEGFVDDTYNAFGLECDDGWYDLIHDLCKEIDEAYRDAGRKIDLIVIQIKEKFGTLRFYYAFEGKPHYLHAFDMFGADGGCSVRNLPKGDDFEDKIAEIVRKYEKKSGSVCEVCGSKGKIRPELGYVQTLCDKCYKERIDRECSYLSLLDGLSKRQQSEKNVSSYDNQSFLDISKLALNDYFELKDNLSDDERERVKRWNDWTKQERLTELFFEVEKISQYKGNAIALVKQLAVISDISKIIRNCSDVTAEEYKDIKAVEWCLYDYYIGENTIHQCKVNLEDGDINV